MEIKGLSGEKIKVPPKVCKEIEGAIRVRALAKSGEIEAKAMTEEAKDTLLPLLVCYKIESYGLEGVGTVMSKVSKGSNINSKKLTEALLNEGIGAATIVKIIDKASNTWSTEYVDFKAAK